MTNLGGSIVSPFSGYPHLLLLRQSKPIPDSGLVDIKFPYKVADPLIYV
jgi:hypothetical protein